MPGKASRAAVGGAGLAVGDGGEDVIGRPDLGSAEVEGLVDRQRLLGEIADGQRHRPPVALPDSIAFRYQLSATSSFPRLWLTLAKWFQVIAAPLGSPITPCSSLDPRRLPVMLLRWLRLPGLVEGQAELMLDDRLGNRAVSDTGQRGSMILPERILLHKSHSQRHLHNVFVVTLEYPAAR